MIRYDTPTQTRNAVTAASLGELTPDQRTRLNQITGRIKQRHRSQIQSILDTGQDLLKAKGMLGHGAFLDWLDAEFGWSIRTAQRIMGAATHFGGKYDTVSHLNVSALYQLAAPSTPDDVRDRLVRRIEKGERVTADQVKELATKAKKPEADTVRDNGVEVMDEPRQPGIADTKPVEIDATAELVSSSPIQEAAPTILGQPDPKPDTGTASQAGTRDEVNSLQPATKIPEPEKPSQPETVSDAITTSADEAISAQVVTKPNAGISAQPAQKIPSTEKVTQSASVSDGNVTDVAERIRLQRQDRVVSMLLNAVGQDTAQELVYFFNEGEWNAQGLFDDLVGRLRERTRSARPAI